MTKKQHRMSGAMILFLAFATGLLAAQFVKLISISVDTSPSTPGRTFLYTLTLIAGVAAVMGLVGTARATRTLMQPRPVTA